MSNEAITIYEKGLIEFKPTQIVEIAVDDLSAPMETAIELTKMAVIMKNIWLDILQRPPKNEDGKHVPNPAALPWMKEFRMTVKDIHEMTKGVQEKVMMKQMDIMAGFYKEAMKSTDTKGMISKIKELQKNVGSSE